ncbi:type II toxin-antitoxin system VapC family toxin [Micromonospora chokoriensis]|uniref:type II toxin-antitoxin system VapC family toxin n=1 Tax=Micromonospora chokoriensis TaxID=356851 RepID=UPI0018D58672|nr:PIN domain-containing protein [Micromonospora chokoriensis]
MPSRPSDATTTLVDANVLLDIFTDDPKWAEWSGAALAEARDAGNLVINPIVYAEVSVRFDRIEELDEALPAGDFLREELPYLAGFLAGKAYARYRKLAGGCQDSLGLQGSAVSARPGYDDFLKSELI